MSQYEVGQYDPVDPVCPEAPAHGHLYRQQSGDLMCLVTRAIYGRGPSWDEVGPLLRPGQSYPGECPNCGYAEPSRE